MSQAIAAADLRNTAPPALRRRIEASLPQTARRAGAGAQGLCDGIGGVGAGRDRSGRNRAAATTTSSASCRKSSRRICARAGRTPDRRDLHRSAYGEAVVQRQARRIAAGDRSHRAGLYPGRRPARLRRCPRHRRRRLSPPATCHQPVRRADPDHRAARRQDRNDPGIQTSAAGAKRIEILAVSDIGATSSPNSARSFQTAMQANKER